MRRTYWIAVALAFVLAVVLPSITGCTGDTNGDGDTPAADGGTTPEEPETPESPDTSGDETPTPESPPSEEMMVSLFWVSAGENALGVPRTLPYSEAVATAAVNALLGGPTDAETTTWPAIGTAIPEGSKLLGLTIDDGVAKIDLSREFESGGGTFSVTARLAQVVYTLDQFPTVNAVEFYIEGKKVDVFSSEGIVLDGPQTLDDFDELLPIDA